MPPHWVRDLNDYWRWLEELEAGLPCFHDNGVGLFVQQDIDDENDEQLRFLRVPRQTIGYYDGTELDFSFDVDEDLDLVRYRYQYQRQRPFTDVHELIFRLEFGPVPGQGFQPHVHVPQDPAAHYPYRPVEFDEVLEAIRDYQASETLPIPEGPAY